MHFKNQGKNSKIIKKGAKTQEKKEQLSANSAFGFGLQKIGRDCDTSLFPSVYVCLSVCLSLRNDAVPVVAEEGLAGGQVLVALLTLEHHPPGAKLGHPGKD